MLTWTCLVLTKKRQTSLAVLHLGTVCDRFSCKHYYRVCNCCRQYGQRKPSWFESDPMHYADSSFVVIEHSNWCERPRWPFARALLWNGCGSSPAIQSKYYTLFCTRKSTIMASQMDLVMQWSQSVRQFSAIALENAWKWFWNRRTASNESTVALHYFEMALVNFVFLIIRSVILIKYKKDESIFILKNLVVIILRIMGVRELRRGNEISDFCSYWT